MKILEHGRFYNDGNKIKCNNCGCVFIYNDKDVARTYSVKYDCEYYSRLGSIILCPECNNDIIVD